MVIKYYSVDKDIEGDTPKSVAFSASKRFYKKAVHRNKVKRWIREAYRQNQYEIIDNPNSKLMLFIIAKKGIMQCEYNEINIDLQQLIQQLNRYLQSNYSSTSKSNESK